MSELEGPISDRIRSGDIPAQYLEKSRLPVDDRPAAWAVAGGSGYGLGDGATRVRSGPGAMTHDHQIGEASMSREEHFEEVGLAGTLVGEAQEVCAVLTEKAGQVLALVANATGGVDSNSEAGRNATEHAQRAVSLVEDVYASLEHVLLELESYRGGF